MMLPLNHYYYDLLNVETLHWQIELARKYGIYGFCIYHYWFKGHLLLHKPLQLYLENKNLDFPFCLCWANESWSKSWNVNSKTDILIHQNYGSEEMWKAHFEFLYPFLSDKRYIKINGKPLLVIYRPELIPELIEMLSLWIDLAKQRGLVGISYAVQQRFYNVEKDKGGELFDFQIEYQPAFVRNQLIKHMYKEKTVQCVCYDDVWNEVLQYGPLNHKSIPGAFVDWDNTPRKKLNGVVFTGATPDKFYNYFSKQIERTKNIYKKDMIFLFSWNEWSEGGYLEPDEKMKYGYLDAIKKVNDSQN